LVNYKRLHYLWMVAKEGAIAGASERLPITPRTMSGQITLLETHFGTVLFQKSDQNIKPTESGLFALHFADEIVLLCSQPEQMLHHLPDSRPKQL
jgi:LysR family transcriptional activator of nhaA